MNDAALFHALNQTVAGGAAVALATVVLTRGSTPQKCGAKMAVLASGASLGTVGGGCAEAKVRSACLDALLKTRRPRVIEVCLTDDAGTADGDVCGGVMRVLVEPFFPE